MKKYSDDNRTLMIMMMMMFMMILIMILMVTFSLLYCKDTVMIMMILTTTLLIVKIKTKIKTIIMLTIWSSLSGSLQTFFCSTYPTLIIFFSFFSSSDGELQNPPVPKEIMEKLARMEMDVRTYKINCSYYIFISSIYWNWYF